MKRIHFVVLLALLVPTIAAAQVYRCEMNGRTVYSQAPCSGESVRIDLGPNATSSATAREAALQREIETLRAEIQHLGSELDKLAAQRDTGRTEYDLRTDKSDSFECKQAMRSYEISSSRRSYDTEQRRLAAYAACGLREPDRGTTVIVR
jgi:hypothetical protein